MPKQGHKNTKNNILASTLYHKLEKFDPSDKYMQTYRNKNIIKKYKKFTEQKLTTTNTILRIYTKQTLEWKIKIKVKLTNRNYLIKSLILDIKTLNNYQQPN